MGIKEDFELFRKESIDIIRNDLLDCAQEVIDAMVRNVQDRTGSGQDVYGVGFQPYSESHAKKRQTRGLQTSYVDLWFEGNMRPNIRTKSELVLDGVSGVAYFQNNFEEMKAYWHNIGAGRLPIRYWFGMDENKDLAEAYKIAQTFLESRGYS